MKPFLSIDKGVFKSKRLINITDSTICLRGYGCLFPTSEEASLTQALVSCVNSEGCPSLPVRTYIPSKLPEFNPSILLLCSPLTCAMHPERPDLFFLSASPFCRGEEKDTFNNFSTLSKLYS